MKWALAIAAATVLLGAAGGTDWAYETMGLVVAVGAVVWAVAGGRKPRRAPTAEPGLVRPSEAAPESR